MKDLTLEGLRDVKPPVGLPADYWIWFLILGIVLAAVAVFFFLRSRNKPEQKKEEPKDPRLPWQIALDELTSLQKQDYLAQRQFKEYYSQLSDIIRRYFERQFQVRAPEMTTEEFLWSLENSGELNSSQKATLKEFMNSCDMVKFAKYAPEVNHAQDSFQFAKRLIDETKKEISAQ